MSIRMTEYRKSIYNHERDVFNQTRSPYAFYCLTRTSYNGLVRFNSSGDFNASLHFGRKGMYPAKVAKLIRETHGLIQKTQFMCCDYRETLDNISVGDFIFLDPPYFDTKSGTMYGDVSLTPQSLGVYIDSLNSSGVKWMLTYDGEIDDNLYYHKISTKQQSSSFSRMKSKPAYSNEWVYTNYEMKG